MNPETLSYIGLAVGMLALFAALVFRVRRYRKRQVPESEGHGVIVFMIALLIFVVFMVVTPILPQTRPVEQISAVLFVSYLIGLALWGCWVLLEMGTAVLRSFREEGTTRGVLNSTAYVLIVLVLAFFVLTVAETPGLHSLIRWPWPLWLKLLTALLGATAATAATWYSKPASHQE